MVYKDVVSSFKLGFKVSSDDEDADGVEVSNTSTTGWEELTFDFTDYIGKTYSYIEFIPDFAADARTYGSINYWDNITFGSGSSGISQLSFDVSDLSAGTYIVTLELKDGRHLTQKVVKL